MTTFQVQWVTVWFIALALICTGVADLWLAFTRGPEASVSIVILELSRKWPIIPFAAGMLAGHLFWPQ